MASKWKKRLKKIGKVAAIAGAAALAAKLGKKSGVVGVNRPGDKSVPGMLGDRGFRLPRVPDRISSPLRPSHMSYADKARKYMQIPSVYTDEVINLKKGGKVTGIAKRGFGRALMKGKK